MKLDLINPSKSPFSKGRLLIFPLLEKGGAGGDLGLTLMFPRLWTKCEGKVDDGRAFSSR
jgi:hypothetical protein